MNTTIVCLFFHSGLVELPKCANFSGDLSKPLMKLPVKKSRRKISEIKRERK